MLALIAAGILTLGGLAGLVYWLRLPIDAPQTSRAQYAAGPLLLLWVAALLVPSPIVPQVKGPILLGMLLTLLAVGLWQSGVLPPYAAYAHLIIAYILYGGALAAVPAGGFSFWALLLLIPAALLAFWFRRSLAELWWSVLLFALALFLALWHTFSWLVLTPTSLAAWLALLGVGLLIVAHLGQAFSAFRPWRYQWAGAALPLLGFGHAALVWVLWLLVLPVP